MVHFDKYALLETATQKGGVTMHPNEHCNCRYADVGCDKMEQVMDPDQRQMEDAHIIYGGRTAPCTLW